MDGERRKEEGRKEQTREGNGTEHRERTQKTKGIGDSVVASCFCGIMN